VAITVLVFAPTLALRRVAYDDPWLWSDTSPLRAPSMAVLRHVWLELDARARHDLGTEYLPVRDMVVAADMAVWGGNETTNESTNESRNESRNERGPHATQLALYALSVLGLGGLLVRFGLRRDLAWLATLLWAIHPIHVESVAWLSERKGVLAGLLAIACGQAWIRYRRGGGSGWVLAGAAAAVAATWSKAPAMFAPAVFAAWDLLVLPAGRRRWIAIAAIGGAAALAAIPVVVVASGAGVVDNEFAIAPDGRLISALGAVGHYVESLVLARPPSLSYPIQTAGAGPLELVLGAAAAIGSLALAVVPRGPMRAWRRAVLAWTWIWFLPISHLLAVVHIVVADRFAYLWSLGGCAGAAWLVLQLRGPVRLAVAGALVCVLGVASLRAEAAWTSSIELFGRGLAASPGDPVACQRLAGELFSAGQRAEALAVIDRGLALHPDHPYLLADGARVLAALHRPVEALVRSERAARSGHASTLALHAELLAAAGRRSEAAAFAERAARRRPEIAAYTEAWVELLLALGRRDQAEAVARERLARDPGPASAGLLGRVFANRSASADDRR
jgi:tetratricopeptide (TPR) repeat protein